MSTPSSALRYNPFRPNTIVTTGIFSGRVEELFTLEKILFQTKNGNPQHFLIQGERGIGKSSLLFYLQCIAKGEIPSLNGENFKFITVPIELDPSNSYYDLVQRVWNEFRRALSDHHRTKEIIKTGWDFLKRFEVMGVKYNSEAVKKEPHELLDELTFMIDSALSELGNNVDGALILIDEADKPPAEANVGLFSKLFTERLAKRGCNRVSVGLAGITGILEKLKASHESSPRVFEIMNLDPLSIPERLDVVQKALEDAHQKNGFPTNITPEAQKWVCVFSEGYPHFIQQMGYSSFDSDSDNNITEDDVMAGAFKENGAFQQLGHKYFHDLYFDQIGSDEYRQVLRAMSEHLDGWVAKAEIRKVTRLKETTLGNALAALRARRIIITKPGAAGIYRLPTRSFAVWIRAYTGGRESLGQGQQPPNQQQ